VRLRMRVRVRVRRRRHPASSPGLRPDAATGLVPAVLPAPLLPGPLPAPTPVPVPAAAAAAMLMPLEALRAVLVGVA
jgi:hypothetical protein